MNISFVTTGGRAKAVWVDGEVVGNLIRGIGKPWAFTERLDYLGISPRAATEIRASVVDHIALLNITARLTS